jgi:FG-GAP-like repeat
MTYPIRSGSVPQMAHLYRLLLAFVLSSFLVLAVASHAQTGVAPSYSDVAFATQTLISNAQFDVLTQHNDVARTGAASHEDILTPANVKSGQFGFLGSVPVEGKVYAQPLFVQQAAVVCSNEGSQAVSNINIAYLATLENYIYAIDVDSQQVCWKTTQLGVPQNGGGLNGFDPSAEGGVRVGIVSTPVIDLQRSVLFAATRVRNADNTGAEIFLNSLDLRTGGLIATAKVQSDGSNGCSGHAFDATRHMNRAGLLLVGNKVFLAFGATVGEDTSVDIHGFVIGFDVTDSANLRPMDRIYCSTPTTDGGGIWMAGAGLTSDGSSIYAATGNGAYRVFANGEIVDPESNIPDAPPANNYPESFIKLSVADLSLQAAFTDTRKLPNPPYVFSMADQPPSGTSTKHTLFWARERSDADLGSAGVLLLGNRLVGGGKDGRFYALDTAGLTRVQDFLAFFDADTYLGTNPSMDLTYNFNTRWYTGPNIHGGPVAWDVRSRATGPYIYVYAWSEKDSLKRFTFVPSAGMFSGVADANRANPTPMPYGSVVSPFRSMPGGMLSLSSNAATNGIVWAIVEEPYSTKHLRDATCFGSQPSQLEDCLGCFLSNGTFVPNCDATRGYVQGRLFAFAADDNGIGQLPLLWGDKRSTNPNNVIPRYSKFTPPTVAHGKVIVPTANGEVRIYGLRPCSGNSCSPSKRHVDDLVAAWDDAGFATFAMYASTGSQFSPNTQWKIRDGGWGDSVRWLSGDFDGDGRADVIAIWNDAGENTLTVRRSTGSGFVTEHWAIRKGPWVDSTQWVAGDFNGDGLTDVAAVWNDVGNATFTVFLSTGCTLESRVDWAKKDGGWAEGAKWVSGDFDGDGLSDIAAIWNDGGQNTLTVRRSTRSAFQTSHWDIHDGGWIDSTKWVAGDFDGDGRCDIAAVWNDGGNATFSVFRSTGLAFAYHSQWKIRDGGWDDSMQWVSGDFNGDGLSDIVAIWNDGGTNTLSVRQSTGSSFITSHWDVHDGGWMNQTRWLAGTFR